MIGNVTYSEAEVTLTLTSDEYKVLRGLVYQRLGGDHPVRYSLGNGFKTVDDQLGTRPCFSRARGEKATTVEGLLRLFA